MLLSQDVLLPNLVGVHRWSPIYVSKDEALKWYKRQTHYSISRTRLQNFPIKFKLRLKVATEDPVKAPIETHDMQQIVATLKFLLLGSQNWSRQLRTGITRDGRNRIRAPNSSLTLPLDVFYYTTWNFTQIMLIFGVYISSCFPSILL